MDLKLENKVVIVTGASKGIGAGIAKGMASAGAKVIVNYASGQEDANRTVQTILSNGGSAIAIQCDVSKYEDVKRLFEETKRAFGRVDVLVNNAGIYKFDAIEDVKEKDFYRQFEINVLGVLLTTQEAIKYFGSSGGSIINIGSMATRNFDAGTVIYTATKGAVDVMTNVLAKELGNKNIRVNSILPGLTQTEGANSVGILDADLGQKIIDNTSLGRLGLPEDIGKVAVFLASDNSYWITGEKISVSGGYF